MGTKQTELRSIIISLLRQKIGFGVELFDVLSIDELEDGTFRILDQRDWTQEICKGEEYIFKDVKKAVDKFLALRQERQLGYDFERGDAPPTLAEMDLITQMRNAMISPHEVMKWLSSKKKMTS
jgi:hypothetical protein